MPYYKSKVIVIVYVIFWSIIMLAATFPTLVTSLDISFIQELPLANELCLFPLVMVVVVHLIDEAYLVFTSEIAHEHLKGSFVLNLIFLAFVAVFLMLTTSATNLCVRLIFFILTWISFIIVKYLSIVLSEPKKIELIQLDNNK